MDVDAFIERWSNDSIRESSNSQPFLIQLCGILGVPAPDEERAGDLDYCFERRVRYAHEDEGAHSGRIDCYKRGCFVLEAKGSGARFPADGAGPHAQIEGLMRKAMRQAEAYAKGLDEWPPFLIVVDVGRAIELWVDFARQGKGYTPFPDRARQRITLAQLKDPDVRAMLARVWIDPMSLDPAAHRAEVTTDIAARLGWLVRSIGSRGPGTGDPVGQNAYVAKTARYVMQCIFAMFADSVGLIEGRAFSALLQDYRGDARNFHRAAEDLFTRMNIGGYCTAVHQELKRFNGGLFTDIATIPITEEELEALIEAAKRDWASVEPAIFGSLLEGALDPRQRSSLGAHYTPRAFVERLVGPTIMEPLRAEWEAVEALAMGHHQQGRAREAQALARTFHRKLCALRVLDPACGTGNFLYVAMRMLKDLEDVVLGALVEFGDPQGLLELSSHSVSPENFIGIEKNRYAASIARMVLWIGHLQWHFRTFGDAKPTEPILRDEGAIFDGDAILAWNDQIFDHEATQARMDRDPGRNTGEVTRFINPRPAQWPPADFIIGNPPFMGAKDMRRELGDGYVDALWASRQGRFRSADLVTVWWDMAADILKQKNSRLRRFGFITTNSITQTFSRRVIERHLSGLDAIRLVYAISDHPWIKGGDNASVRIAMSVAERGAEPGSARAAQVVSERDLDTERPVVLLKETIGEIGPDLKTGPGAEARTLKANAGLSSRGVQLMGSGFAVTPQRATELSAQSDPSLPSPLRAYRNGRDLAERPRGLMAIDFFGLGEGEARRGHPGFYQHLLETVKQARDRNNRASYRQNWWLFGEPRREMRTALDGLSRYIVTAETAKHRWFRFLDADILADNKLVVVASDSAAVLGVLSSSAHTAWFVAHCGRIGVYDGDAVYVKGVCFDAFPFPDLSPAQSAEVGSLAEELEAVRQRALARPDGLTLTGLYNVRDRLRTGEALTPEERRVFELGCVGVIHHLHERIDRCVEAAYGWADRPSAEQMVERLMALNHVRAAEEARGQVRALRPEFQQPRHAPAPVGQIEADLRLRRAPSLAPALPQELAGQVIRTLRTAGRPLEPDVLIGSLGFGRGQRLRSRVEDTLSILAVAGTVQRTHAGWFAPHRID